MRVAYYSLANSPDSGREEQWIQSIRSLRRYNQAIPVCLFLFNGATSRLLQEAQRWSVHLEFLGDYQEYLQRVYVRGSVLSLYPHLHKFLSLGNSSFPDASQVLYLDCDTFFFEDIELLFDHYAEYEWYAREEPSSLRSHYAYDPGHIDEDLLQRIAQQEGLQPVIPFNSGVCLLNHGVWNALQSLKVHYLDLAWRLFCGCQLNAPQGTVHDPEMRQAVLNVLSDYDRRRALSYPSTNIWIIDQIALWLTLGHLPNLTLSLLTPAHVLQGGECLALGDSGSRCVVAHYYGTLEREFFSCVPSIPD